jgi:hypothetical protein
MSDLDRPADAFDRAADDLYGAPLDEFVARRDALARELRRSGDREVADRVKALTKPSVPAWAVNRLAREHPDEVAHLLRTGEHLRNVQGWLLRREADPTDLRRAVESERAAAGSLVGRAADLLSAAGRAPRGDVLERIAETLHAAAADDEVRADVERGRLVRDRASVGLGPTVPAGATRRASRERKGRAATPDEAVDAAAADRGQETAAAAAAARDRLRAAEADAKTADRTSAAADRAVERATRTLSAAEDNWERAQDALREARAELAESRKAAAEARKAAEAAAAEVERRRDDAG